jgi:hypothetical protein
MSQDRQQALVVEHTPENLRQVFQRLGQSHIQTGKQGQPVDEFATLQRIIPDQADFHVYRTYTVVTNERNTLDVYSQLGGQIAISDYDLNNGASVFIISGSLHQWNTMIKRFRNGVVGEIMNQVHSLLCADGFRHYLESQNVNTRIT